MSEHPYVGRGGLKLEHAIRTFNLDITGFICADLGSSIGGFTDCLLQHGAARVYSVDTSYGELAWKLRSDDRVTPIERTNALHAEPPEPVDLVTIDLGWTKQERAIPAALGWLKPDGHIITLVKPHYELNAEEKQQLDAGVLSESEAQRAAERVRDSLSTLGVAVIGWTRSPILGGAVGKRKKGKGNVEWLALVQKSSQ